MVASIVQLLNSTVKHPDSFCFFNSLSLAIDFPPHVCDFLVTRWLLCQTSEIHSRQKMWSGKGKRESIESALSVPLCIIKARVLQESPSIVLHWYLSDKIYCTWSLLPTKSPKKLLNSFPSFYRRRQEKINLRKITLQSPPHISTSCLFLLLYYLSCCFLSWVKEESLFILFCCCQTMSSFYAMNFPMRIALTTYHGFWFHVFSLQFSKWPTIAPLVSFLNDSFCLFVCLGECVSLS